MSAESRRCGPNWTRFLANIVIFQPKCIPNIARKTYFAATPYKRTGHISKVERIYFTMLFERAKTDKNLTSYSQLKICVFALSAHIIRFDENYRLSIWREMYTLKQTCCKRKYLKNVRNVVQSLWKYIFLRRIIFPLRIFFWLDRVRNKLRSLGYWANRSIGRH